MFKLSNNIENDNSQNNNELTLKKLVLWTIGPLEKMKWLAIASDAVYCKFLINIK